ncbi:MAG: phosphonate ABC transporter, permease protein PhnE [Alphaproteobacteria bacterium]|jgi:phosphonate transport system permease protein|nr:phosphonate ABC transporter, permease protein PhnE [Alphaproteobacteria bacterium]
MTTVVSSSVLDAVLEERRVTRRQYAIIAMVVLAATLWSAWGTEFNVPKLIEGLPLIYNLGERMLPPDFTILEDLVGPMVETLEMALLGTTIPIFFALPLAFLTAVNTAPSPMVSVLVRLFIGVFRTVPELIWAMVLVTAVGLGPFPGVLALTLHTIGGLGKFYYEAIESADPGVMEAMEAAGASRFKVIWFGVMPNVLPVMMSSTLFYWEYNNRASTVLGLVGAGGIGLALTHALQDFRYPEVVTCLILIVLILVVIDRISAFLRGKII